MYCLVYAQSGLCTAALIFYTCVWLPLVQLKRALLSIFVRFGFYPLSNTGQTQCSFQLPVARLCDLHCHGEEGAVCSICLVEMDQNEDAVSKLPRCGHVFHWSCIDGWLDRGHFTCPLCRSFIFNAR